MRVLLVLGTVLVFAAGTQLYVLSGHTDRHWFEKGIVASQGEP